MLGDIEPTTWSETAAETSTVDEDVVATQLNLMRMVIAKASIAAIFSHARPFQHPPADVNRLADFLGADPLVKILSAPTASMRLQKSQPVRCQRFPSKTRSRLPQQGIGKDGDRTQ